MNKNANLFDELDDDGIDLQELQNDIAKHAQRKITPQSLAAYQREQYTSYAVETIQKRAIPHYRDGFKPVQRRILYAMKNLGCASSFKKSARITGEVIGIYHPHGDSSVYQAMVNIGLYFKQREMLVTPQGNFGHIDGDGPAAMRYTEAKLSDIGVNGLFADIDKNTVDFQPNYDNTEIEPVTLPIRFPQLLVNGVDGIATGLASNCPSHNLIEVLNATLAYHDNPNITTDEIINIMPAPDFPTGGVVFSLDGYRKAIETGSGSIRCRPTYTIEDNTINSRSKKLKRVLVLTSIPFQIKKEKMVKAINELVKNDPQLNEWIDRVNDESANQEVRIAIYLKNEGNDLGELIFNILSQQLPNYFRTVISYNINVTGMPDKRFAKFNFRDIFREFLLFRKEVFIRKSQFLIDKMEKELHLSKGIMLVLQDENTLNETINLIKSHKTTKEANEALCTKFQIDETQAQEILKLSLQKLTTDELDNIVNHNVNLNNQLVDLRDFIKNDERIHKAIKDDLIDFRDRYIKNKDSQRRTEVSYEDLDLTNKAQLTKEESVIILLTESGYVKMLPNDSISKQNRNGKGKSQITTNDDDNIKTITIASTHDIALFFTPTGKVYGTHVWDLPKTDKGRHIKNIFEGISENVINMISLSNNDFEEDKMQIIITTKLGMIRRTSVAEFKSAMGKRANGLIGFKVEPNDEIISVEICKDNDHMMIVTNQNIINRFELNDENLIKRSRKAGGVAGTKLRKDEFVIDAIIIPVQEEQRIYKTELIDNYIQITEEEYQEDTDKRIGKNFFKIDGTKEIQVLDTSLIDEGRYLLTMGENGVGKKCSLNEYKLQKRKAKGLTATKENEKSGKLIKAAIVSDDDEVIITTNQKTIKVSVNNINTYSRTATGNYIMDVNNDKVVGMTIVKNIKEVD